MSIPAEGIEFDVSGAEAAAAEAESFAERVLGILNDGALCLMLSIGHRTGLFEVMRATPPATAGELARRAGLQERYVSEWLEAMSAGGILRADVLTKQYWLPPEHSIALSRGGAAENMAVFAQYIALIGRVEDDIVRCFKEGGGVPYSRYAAFHEVIAEIRCRSVLRSFEAIVRRVAPDLFCKLTEGAKILDFGCGCGALVSYLTERFPNSVFTAMDVSVEAPEACGCSRQQPLPNATSFITDIEDSETWLVPNFYDGVTTLDIESDHGRPTSCAVFTGHFETAASSCCEAPERRTTRTRTSGIH